MALCLFFMNDSFGSTDNTAEQLSRSGTIRQVFLPSVSVLETPQKKESQQDNRLPEDQDMVNRAGTVPKFFYGEAKSS